MAYLTKLKKIVLMDCGKLKSLTPLKNCSLLESLNFAGDTSIDDGELGSLIELPELSSMFFSDKRHYSHKQNQIQQLLS